MIVIIAGMQRSGSTFSFNVARMILEKRGHVQSFAVNTLEDIQECHSNDEHIIIKTHAPDEILTKLITSNSAKCICTIRKPEDAIASWMKTFSFNLNNSINDICTWLNWHKSVSHKTLNVNYEEIDKWPIFVIYKIATQITQDISLIDVVRIWWLLRKKRVKKESDALINDSSVVDIGFSHYNNKTFFHRNHISSIKSTPAVKSLTVDEIKHIREQLNLFIDSNGNYHYNN